MFGLGMVIGPVLILTGIWISISKTYRVQLWLAWGLTMTCMGLCSTLRVDTPMTQAIGYWVFLGLGSGIFYAATYFPVLAPLPISENAHALAFFAFCRSFAGVSTAYNVSAHKLTEVNVGLGRNYRHCGFADPAREEASR